MAAAGWPSLRERGLSRFAGDRRRTLQRLLASEEPPSGPERRTEVLRAFWRRDASQAPPVRAVAERSGESPVPMISGHFGWFGCRGRGRFRSELSGAAFWDAGAGNGQWTENFGAHEAPPAPYRIRPYIPAR